MNPTALFMHRVTELKAGDLGLLRSHACKSLDESVQGFDLFSGLWWPIRSESQRAPRREVAWLVAKLYAFRPIQQTPGPRLPALLRRCRPADTRLEAAFTERFDALLTTPLRLLEPRLQWALDTIAAEQRSGGGLDWVKLLDDLSIWERESVRLRWAREFLGMNERNEQP